MADASPPDVAGLRAFMDTVAFCDRHRAFVAMFEADVFLEFSAALPEGLEPSVAAAVATSVGVLSTLRTLKRAGERDDKAARSFLDRFRWVASAWDAAVVRCGLSLSDYAAVRAFTAGVDDISFPAALEREQALAVLESDVPVPDELVRYKKPLIALLRILASL